MSKTAVSGPFISYGQIPAINGVTTDNNPEAGPSVFYGGMALLDPRSGYQPGGHSRVYGLLGMGMIPVLNQAPSTIAANNIATTTTPVANTPVTLVSTTGGGITVGTSIIDATTGNTVNNLLAIDGVATPVSFGQNGSVQMYDPTKSIARNVRISSVGVDTGATFTVSGYDIYNYPMTETITGATSGGVASGKKAFKYILSVTPAGTLSGSAITIGTGDVYGFPVRSDSFATTLISWNSALITATTGYLAAVTATATPTTGDVRGTYAVQSASDGTKALVVFESIYPGNIGTAAGIFGVTQA